MKYEITLYDKDNKCFYQLKDAKEHQHKKAFYVIPVECLDSLLKELVERKERQLREANLGGAYDGYEGSW